MPCDSATAATAAPGPLTLTEHALLELCAVKLTAALGLFHGVHLAFTFVMFNLWKPK